MVLRALSSQECIERQEGRVARRALCSKEGIELRQDTEQREPVLNFEGPRVVRRVSSCRDSLVSSGGRRVLGGFGQRGSLRAARIASSGRDST